MAQQIIVEIKPDGTTTFDAVGFKGKGCAEATEQLEIAIGGLAAEKKKKPDYFAPPAFAGQKVKNQF